MIIQRAGAAYPGSLIPPEQGGPFVGNKMRTLGLAYNGKSIRAGVVIGPNGTRKAIYNNPRTNFTNIANLPLLTKVAIRLHVGYPLTVNSRTIVYVVMQHNYRGSGATVLMRQALETSKRIDTQPLSAPYYSYENSNIDKYLSTFTVEAGEVAPSMTGVFQDVPILVPDSPPVGGTRMPMTREIMRHRFILSVSEVGRNLYDSLPSGGDVLDGFTAGYSVDSPSNARYCLRDFTMDPYGTYMFPEVGIKDIPYYSYSSVSKEAVRDCISFKPDAQVTTYPGYPEIYMFPDQGGK